MYVTEDGEWRKVHPYSIALFHFFNKTGRNIKVVESGISGQTASEMKDRLPGVLEVNKPRVVVILAGTNDLGQHANFKQITSDITELHTKVLTSGRTPGKHTFSIAVTIPQCSWLKPKGDKKINHDEKRKAVNKAIRLTVERCRTRVGLLDLESIFDQSSEENNKYWSVDMVHFSPLGYDEIGRLVFEVLKGFQVDKSDQDLLPPAGCILP